MRRDLKQEYRFDANVAFSIAVHNGRLSADKSAPNYAGNYMFMGLNNGRDAFKHIVTREYLP